MSEISERPVPEPRSAAAAKRMGYKRRAGIGAGLVLLVVSAFVAGVATERQRAAASDEWSDTRLLSSAIDSVRANALDSLPSDELIRRAVAGMLRELHDPYAALLRPEGIEQYRGSILGEGHGLGLSLRRLRRTLSAGSADVQVSVARVAPGSPAMAAGIRAGDRIVAVDGVPVAMAWARPRDGRGAAKDTATAPRKTQRLTLWRAPRGDTTTVVVTRAPWHMPAVSDAGLLTDSVGYVRLATMSANSADELAVAVQGLVQRGAQSLVLDLRGNGGGLFEEGVKAAGLFLPRGAVVASLAGRTGARVQPHRARLSRWPALPLTVLVDGGTASAAEVVAAALRDYDRALLVGSPTFGKGVVQRVVTLSAEMSLRLTTARWLTPHGLSLQRRSGTGSATHGGLIPDVLLDDATRRDPYNTPTGWSPVESQRAGYVADSLAMHALREKWTLSPSVLLPSQLDAAIDGAPPTIAPRTMRRGAALAEWRAVVARLALIRILEVQRALEPLLRVALTNDAALRAGLDVAAPGSLVPTLATAFATRTTRDAPLLPAALQSAIPTRGRSALDHATALLALDSWLVTRFREVQLLSDSAALPLSAGTLSVLGAVGGRPLVEAVRSGTTLDSLWATQVSAAPTQPMLTAPVTAQLLGPSGEALPFAVRVVARRSLRMPKTASAPLSDSSAWRSGWAYLVLVPHEAQRAATRWLGWSVVAGADAQPRPMRSGAQSPRAP